ncbi:spermatogenesis-associated protein 22 [Echeneis naucrates]|uniref:spermatogenesis-associated protein 22 n=1 Tax=Echeneis naucrates TaxID=173247 RepID=UPI0011146BBD|nr:spermatogenesis-associated protein 22 [Echeneis naucrates]
MRRQETHPARTTAGCLPVPLFNQKKRNRVPLTSTPSVNEFFSHSEYTSEPPSLGKTGTCGSYKASDLSSSGTLQSYQCHREGVPQSPQPQQYESSRLTPGPVSTKRAYAPMPHPYNVGNSSIPSPRAVQPQNKSWKFSNNYFPQRSAFVGKRSSDQPHTEQPSQSQQETFSMKPVRETSLRILTAVIDGMRHWSQFKDKVPYLFEIFATLDSAVTLGHHGAKTFLLRDGKKAVQCVFYENEKELPRLIRGQVHRCVGNYDPSRDVLMCVSVRPGLPSELRNCHEAVKVCDAEMRALTKSLSEV